MRQAEEYYDCFMAFIGACETPMNAGMAGSVGRHVTAEWSQILGKES